MPTYFLISTYNPQASVDDPIGSNNHANQLQINLFDYRHALIQA